MMPYEQRCMLMRQNVNNDVSKDPPTEIKNIFFYAKSKKKWQRRIFVS